MDLKLCGELTVGGYEASFSKSNAFQSVESDTHGACSIEGSISWSEFVLGSILSEFSSLLVPAKWNIKQNFD